MRRRIVLASDDVDIWGRDLLRNKDFWLIFLCMAIEDGSVID